MRWMVMAGALLLGCGQTTGVAGPRGERGEQGEPGPRGETGPRGPAGSPGQAASSATLDLPSRYANTATVVVDGFASERVTVDCPNDGDIMLHGGCEADPVSTIYANRQAFYGHGEPLPTTWECAAHAQPEPFELTAYVTCFPSSSH